MARVVTLEVERESFADLIDLVVARESRQLPALRLASLKYVDSHVCDRDGHRLTCCLWGSQDVLDLNVVFKDKTLDEELVAEEAISCVLVFGIFREFEIHFIRVEIDLEPQVCRVVLCAPP